MENGPTVVHAIVTGLVRFFNESKGFGMITPDAGGSDVFAHSAQIRSPGIKKLKAAQRVSFEIHELPHGRTAANIRVL